MQQAHVAPIKLRTWNEALGVDVVRVVGYRGACPCGWRTPTRETYGEARRETLAHKRDEHGHRPR